MRAKIEFAWQHRRKKYNMSDNGSLPDHVLLEKLISKKGQVSGQNWRVKKCE